MKKPLTQERLKELLLYLKHLHKETEMAIPRDPSYGQGYQPRASEASPKDPPDNFVMGDRHNQGKPKISLVFDAPFALKGVAEILEQGIHEYGRCNWKKGLPVLDIIDSMSRHILAFQNGENIDPKSGKPHVHHITANALFLGEMYETRPDCDDREPAMVAASPVGPPAVE